MLVIEDREETIEEDIEDSNETNTNQRSQISPHTPIDKRNSHIPIQIDGEDNSPYHDQPIGYSASLRKKDATILQESVLPLLRNTNSRESQALDNDRTLNSHSESKKSHTYGRRTRLSKEGDSPEIGIEKIKPIDSYLQKDLLDRNITENKKKLLYDKQLKAYYDPETGQYFEMKDQLINATQY